MPNFKVIKKSDMPSSVWSGGTTTQLYISPENGDYKARSFDVRVSSATVDTEQSEFTALPGYWRYIMPLQGQMALQHTKQHSVTLKSYEVDSFSGGWQTLSIGRCTDFNLMLKDGMEGQMKALKQGEYSLTAATNGIYALAEGINVTVTVGDAPPYKVTLALNDFLLITNLQEEEMKATLLGDNDRVIAAFIAVF